MKAYFVQVGSKRVGPFKSEAGAKAEAKSLREDGYTVTVVSKTIKETEFSEFWGDPEVEVSLDDDDDDTDWLDELLGDSEETDDEEETDDDDDDEKWIKELFEKLDDDDDDEEEEEEEKKEPEKEDDEPEGKHPFFQEWGKKK